VTALVGAVAVLAAGLVKGAVGFGFPLLATPLLAAVLDVKTAMALAVPPNIALDGWQAVRRGSPVATVRRLWLLMICGVAGTVLGTRLLALLPARVLTAILGAFVVLFVALNATRLAPRVPARWERWLSPPIGLLAGVVGGITNVPGTPLVIYFYALGMGKDDFVRAVAFTFIVYKGVQLGALVWYGIFTWSLVLPSAALCVVGGAGFLVGLRIQDRLDQRAFNRVVLGFLVCLGAWLVVRSLA
jgi:uncharacterized membrane protein YfcA